MNKEIIKTADGSSTVFVPQLSATYHSVHGAVQESNHVFIHHGLKYYLQQNHPISLKIFEMGLGTGLNALLSHDYAQQKNIHVHYEAVELFPLDDQYVHSLNYFNEVLKKIHEAAWGETKELNPFYSIKKINQSLTAYQPTTAFHLIYFDAFAPDVQPELWSETVFRKMYEMLLSPGALVTYCSKGNVRRAMLAAGFVVEKLKGPPGKREMVRALK